MTRKSQLNAFERLASVKKNIETENITKTETETETKTEQKTEQETFVVNETLETNAEAEENENLNETVNVLQNTIQETVTKNVKDEVKQNMEYNPFAELKNIPKRETVEDTHVRQTYLIRKDLIDELNELAKGKSRGFKTRVVNQALEYAIKMLKDER